MPHANQNRKHNSRKASCFCIPCTIEICMHYIVTHCALIVVREINLCTQVIFVANAKLSIFWVLVVPGFLQPGRPKIIQKLFQTVWTIPRPVAKILQKPASGENLSSPVRLSTWPTDLISGLPAMNNAWNVVGFDKTKSLKCL